LDYLQTDLSATEICYFLLSFIKSCRTLGLHGILHRDLKPENLILKWKVFLKKFEDLSESERSELAEDQKSAAEVVTIFEIMHSFIDWDRVTFMKGTRFELFTAGVGTPRYKLKVHDHLSEKQVLNTEETICYEVNQQIVVLFGSLLNYSAFCKKFKNRKDKAKISVKESMLRKTIASSSIAKILNQCQDVPPKTMSDELRIAGGLLFAVAKKAGRTLPSDWLTNDKFEETLRIGASAEIRKKFPEQFNPTEYDAAGTERVQRSSKLIEALYLKNKNLNFERSERIYRYINRGNVALGECFENSKDQTVAKIHLNEQDFYKSVSHNIAKDSLPGRVKTVRLTIRIALDTLEALCDCTVENIPHNILNSRGCSNPGYLTRIAKKNVLKTVDGSQKFVQRSDDLSCLEICVPSKLIEQKLPGVDVLDWWDNESSVIFCFQLEKRTMAEFGNSFYPVIAQDHTGRLSKALLSPSRRKFKTKGATQDYGTPDKKQENNTIRQRAKRVKDKAKKIKKGKKRKNKEKEEITGPPDVIVVKGGIQVVSAHLKKLTKKATGQSRNTYSCSPSPSRKRRKAEKK